MAIVTGGAAPLRLVQGLSLDGYYYAGYTTNARLVAETEDELVVAADLILETDDPDDPWSGAYPIVTTLTTGRVRDRTIDVSYSVNINDDQDEYLHIGNSNLDYTDIRKLENANSDRSFYSILLNNDDSIYGSSYDDVLSGFEGKDLIKGLGGDDILLDFAADSLPSPWRESDDLFGGHGDDILAAEALRAATLDGEAGDDVVIADVLSEYSYTGSIFINGGAGDDFISVAYGNKSSIDSIYLTGGAGEDYIILNSTPTGFGYGLSILDFDPELDFLEFGIAIPETVDLLYLSEEVYRGGFLTAYGEEFFEGVSDVKDMFGNIGLLLDGYIWTRVVNEYRGNHNFGRLPDSEDEYAAFSGDYKSSAGHEYVLSGYNVEDHQSAEEQIKLIGELLNILYRDIKESVYLYRNQILEIIFSGQVGEFSVRGQHVTFSFSFLESESGHVLDSVRFEFQDGAQYNLGLPSIMKEYFSEGAPIVINSGDYSIDMINLRPAEIGYEFQDENADVIVKAHGLDVAKLEGVKAADLIVGKNILAPAFTGPEWRAPELEEHAYSAPDPLGKPSWGLSSDGEARLQPEFDLEAGRQKIEDLLARALGAGPTLDNGVYTIEKAGGLLRFGGDQDDVLTGQGVLVGHAGDDRLRGPSSIFSILDGGGGDDHIVGLGFILGGDGADEITVLRTKDAFELDKDVWNIEFGVGSVVYGGDGRDVITHNGSLQDAPVLLYGDAGHDKLEGVGYLYGGEGNDTLRGGSGYSRLEGGPGEDILIDGSGDTVFVIDHEPDRILGGDGGFFRGANEIVAPFYYPFDERFAFRMADGVNFEIFDGVESKNIFGNELANSIHGEGGDDTLYGIEGDDRLYGGLGQDKLYGGAGDDVLQGGPGRDLLYGGGGNDVYILDDTNDEVFEDRQNGGYDTIIAPFFRVTLDILWAVEEYILTGDAAVDMTGSYISNRYVGNGASNTIRGLGGDDTLLGGGGADVLDGGDGDDVLDGGAGADRMVGGAGNDRYVIDDPGDIVEEASPNGGWDIVEAPYVLELPANVEEFKLSGFTAADIDGSVEADALSGNDARNQIDGRAGDDRLNGYGGDDFIIGGQGADRLNGGDGDDDIDGGDDSDILEGGEGDDILRGGRGDDRLDGGGGFDVVDYVDAEAGVDFALDADGEVNDGRGGIDMIVAIEGAYGGAFEDRFSGNDDANVFDGRGGADVLFGRGGDDIIDGGDGDDRLGGGDGDDVLDGGAGLDLADYADQAMSVVVDLGAGRATDGSGATDLLRNVEGAIGTAFADLLIGDAADNVFEGGDGDDVLTGGLGDDVLDGGEGMDRVEFAEAATAVSYVVGVASVEDGQGGIDTLVGIEGAGGGAFADRLFGNGAANALLGRGGDDLLSGAGGDDILGGGAGEDRLIGGSGADDMDGGDDVDLVDYVNESAGVAVDLDAGRAIDGGGSTDRLRAIEDVLGSDHDDALFGDAARNTLTGRAGADVLFGAAGDDLLRGGDGDDVLAGGSGDDRLDGGAGVDRVEFGDAEAGVVYSAEEGVATDGRGGVDALVNIEEVSGGAFGDRIVGADAAELFLGQAGDDSLDGGAGDDVLEGGDGDDVLAGGLGDDWLVGGEGMDLVDFSGAAAGVTYVAGGGQVSDGLGGVDTLTGIEGAIASAFADSCFGSNIANVFEGRGGDDVLSGRGGDDFLDGGDGDDQLIGGTGADVMDGGAGRDLLNYANEAGRVDINLASGAAMDGGGAMDRVRDIEDVTGSGFDDVLRGDIGGNMLTGNDGADRLYGGRGDDQLVGGGDNDRIYCGNLDDVAMGDAGADMLQGDAGDDVLNGGSENDRLYGGSGDDVLNGDAGIDLLDGSGGMDRYNGGAGADRLFSRLDGVQDTFDFDLGAGADRIFRYELGIDRIGLSADFGFTSGADALANMTAAVINSGGHAVLNLNGVDTIQIINFALLNPGGAISDLADDIYIF